MLVIKRASEFIERSGGLVDHKEFFYSFGIMKLTTEKINELLGVDESFHASYKLIEILSSPSERELLFTNFLKKNKTFHLIGSQNIFKRNIQTEKARNKILHQMELFG